ncbi:hypothetical protein pdam_00001961 [Pocillopora damicornis]|uniref:Uncharacterized protein n=1 Tax=Pocillopora damicornis TaxID=46731 RepID=A0A3M6TQ43_POCDA|nr:hypothetical protein pdam_00001961 [Pocillopora damicornis]
MDLLSSSFTADDGFEPKPTRLSFLLTKSIKYQTERRKAVEKHSSQHRSLPMREKRQTRWFCFEAASFCKQGK